MLAEWWLLCPREDDHGGGHDVLDARAAGEVADRPRESLQHRADRARAGHALGELVADVSRVEVGKNEDVGSPCDGTFTLQLLRRHLRHESGIGLQFTVYREIRRACPGERESVRYFFHARVLRAAFGGKREQRDAGLLAQKYAASLRGSERDVGERLGIRIHVHRAVRVDEVLCGPALPAGNDHQEKARRRAYAVRKPRSEEHTSEL